MAATVNINWRMGCEDCCYANEHGQDCKHGLLFPVLAMIAGYERCPNFENKTSEQIEEQLRLKEYERKMEKVPR